MPRYNPVALKVLADHIRSAYTDTQLVELYVSDLKLQALENGGVDNWDWYDESLSEFRDSLEQEGLLL